MNALRSAIIEKIMAALPGTSEGIAGRSGVGIGTVRRYLRAWIEAGDVRRQTRWFGNQSYTWVYSIKERPRA